MDAPLKNILSSIKMHVFMDRKCKVKETSVKVRQKKEQLKINYSLVGVL